MQVINGEPVLFRYMYLYTGKHMAFLNVQIVGPTIRKTIQREFW